MRTVFPTEELRDEAVEKYHAIEGGQQTLSNLAAYVTEIVRKGAGGLMAGKVFFSVSMSLDGFIAPESMDFSSPTAVDGWRSGWNCSRRDLPARGSSGRT